MRYGPRRTLVARDDDPEHSVKNDPGPFPATSTAEWRETVERDLRGATLEERLVTRTIEGLDIRPLYTADETPPDAATAAPGCAPFIRGRRDAGGWTIRQVHDVASPTDVNRHVLEDLSGGVEAFQVRLDRSGRTGSTAAEDFGRDGTVIVSLDDLDRALRDAPIERLHIAIDAGGNTAVAFALLRALAERRGIAPSGLSATISGDPLGALARDGELPGTLSAAWDQVAGAIELAADDAPGVRPWVCSGRAWHDAGADGALDLALTIASSIDGLRELSRRGAEPGVAARHVEFQIGIGRDLFMEIARLRALRQLWSRVLELCGAPDAAGDVRIHANTSWRTLARRDPWVNMLRATTATFSAIAGGADSIGVAPFDAALGVPSPLARRVARNTQLVLRDESSLGVVADPAGGSWYVESLTEAIAERAWKLLQDVERQGGLGEALRSGWVRDNVAASAQRAEDEIRNRARPVTGVSNYANPDEAAPSTPAPGPLPKPPTRDEVPAPSGTEPQEAIAKGASLVAVTRATHAGESRAVAPALEPRREAEAFEHLMDAADAFAGQSGAPPRIFMAAWGPLPKHRARATWTTHAFHAGGIRVLAGDAAADVAGAVEAFRQSGARAAVIVTDDESLAESLADAVRGLRAAGAKWIAVAGRPKPTGDVEPDAMVYAGCDLLEVLTRCHAALEVL
jgi:methylmalonyl-CoA mutase